MSKESIHNVKNKFIGFLFIVMLSIPVLAQRSHWKKSTYRSSSSSFSNLKSESFHINSLNLDGFKKDLISVPHRENLQRQHNVVMYFPNELGAMERFRIQEVSIFSEKLAAQFPNIKAYVGYGIDTPGARVRFSMSPQGLQSMISYPNKLQVFTVPVTKGNNSEYITYSNDSRVTSEKHFNCQVDHGVSSSRNSNTSRDADDQMLRTYRIAIAATGEYTQFWDDGNNANGDAREDALAQIVSTLNRMNEVYEVDMAITFQLVSGINIVYPDPNSDPYDPSDFFDLPNENQSAIDAAIGSSNYDVGHLLHFGSDSENLGNGVALLSSVCITGSKAKGVSAHTFVGDNGTPYMSDYFDIDYVPHEVGHQMGANHTWSFTSEGTGVNVEPGSGTTIMGYAGIRAEDNVQIHSDAYFHYHSIRQILNRANAATCWTSTAISNNPPVANAGSDYTIPQGTAFVLKGTATDADAGDALTYTWEQIDSGVSNFENFGPTLSSGGTFRSRPPSSSPNRYMPNLSRILLGQLTETDPVLNAQNTSWETVSTISRTLNFAFTVRDRSETNGTGQFPQTSFDTTTITVDGNSGPFTVTSQSTNVVWEEGQSRTVTWDVAGTNSAPVNTSQVNILLSIDGGQTYPFTLASATDNDGTQSVTVPDIGVTTTIAARIMIEAVDNIFLAVNATDFTIQEASAAVDEEGLIAFRLYPNPSKGDFRLEFEATSAAPVDLVVYDLTGRSIYSKNYSNVFGFFEETISLGAISKGVYFIRVVNGDRFTVRKILIE